MGAQIQGNVEVQSVLTKLMTKQGRPSSSANQSADDSLEQEVEVECCSNLSYSVLCKLRVRRGQPLRVLALQARAELPDSEYADYSVVFLDGTKVLGGDVTVEQAVGCKGGKLLM